MPPRSLREALVVEAFWRETIVKGKPGSEKVLIIASTCYNRGYSYGFTKQCVLIYDDFELVVIIIESFLKAKPLAFLNFLLI